MGGTGVVTDPTFPLAKNLGAGDGHPKVEAEGRTVGVVLIMPMPRTRDATTGTFPLPEGLGMVLGDAEEATAGAFPYRRLR